MGVGVHEMEVGNGDEAIGMLAMFLAAFGASDLEGIAAGPEEADERALLFVLLACDAGK